MYIFIYSLSFNLSQKNFKLLAFFKFICPSQIYSLVIKYHFSFFSLFLNEK